MICTRYKATYSISQRPGELPELPASCILVNGYLCLCLWSVYTASCFPRRNLADYFANPGLIIRGGSTLGQGGTWPQIHLLPPDSKAGWQSWRDFWGPQMLKNPNFPGLRPGPRWWSLQWSSDPLSDGIGRGLAAPCQEPHPWSRPFGPRFYGSQGLTHYRVGNSTNDRFQL